MVTSAQCRAARGLLNWTVRDLAREAGVHRNTVTRIENDATGPGHSVAAIRLTFEAQGIQFLDTGEVARGPGVALGGNGTSATEQSD